MMNLHESPLSIRMLGVWFLGLTPLVGLFNPWEMTSVSGLSIRVIDILFLAMCLLLFVSGAIRPKISIRVISYLIVLLILYLISLLGVFALSSYEVQWSNFFRFTETLLWGAFALAFIKEPGDLKLVARNIILAGAILGLASMYLFTQGVGLHRVAGYFSAAGGEGYNGQASFNEIGALHALAATLSLCWLFFSKTGSLWQARAFIGVGLILNVIGLGLAQSRSALLAVVAGSFAVLFPEIARFWIYSFYGRINKRFFFFSLFGFVLVFLLLIGAVVGSEEIMGINRLTNTFSAGSSEHKSLMTRFMLWEKAFSIWLDDAPIFLLGGGFWSAERLLGEVTTDNLFVDVSLSMGLIGLIALIVLFIWPLQIHEFFSGSRQWDSLSGRFGFAAFAVAFMVSLSGDVLIDPFFGASTFLVLYGAFSVRLSVKHSIQGGLDLK